MNISAYIPAAFRKPLYGAFAVAGVVIGAIQVGIAAIGAANPEWLLVTLAVFPFVAGAVGFTASANTNQNSDQLVEVYELPEATDCDVDDNETSDV